MKLIDKIYLAIACIAMVVSLSGCDQIRKLAGRPTSADIQVIRERIAAEEARAKEIADSIALAEKLAEQERKDSLEAVEAFAQHVGYLRGPEDLHGIRKGDLDHRYYVAVGAFRQEENAKRLAGRFDQEIYHPAVIATGAGLNIVLVYPNNKLMGAYRSFMDIKTNPECPREAWVLVNDPTFRKK